jgi:hypothetical protein
MGNVYIYLYGAWENRVLVEETISAGFNRADITLYRDGDISDFIVAYRDGQSTSIASTSDVTFTVGEQDFPITYALRGLSGAWYNKTVFSESSGSAVTIYIRDARTGDLIPGAVLSILDGTTGTVIVNEALPTGQESYTLEKAYTLRYSAQATATNYTSFGATQFGLGDDPLPLVLWMYPDDPVIEEPTAGKTALYGYVLTQGSQQPISGATVTLSGNGDTTTSSTGSYLFNNIDPGTYTISASAPLHDTLTESVTVDATATQHNLALKGHYILRITVKDADSLKTLTNATTISLSDGQERNDQTPPPSPSITAPTPSPAPPRVTTQLSNTSTSIRSGRPPPPSS